MQSASERTDPRARPGWLPRRLAPGLFCLVVLGACDESSCAPGDAVEPDGSTPPASLVDGSMPVGPGGGFDAASPVGPSDDSGTIADVDESDAKVDAGPPPAPFSPPEPVGCIASVGAGLTEFTCDGIGYRVSVAQACMERACGLIVDVHGGTMSAKMEDNNTELSRIGNEHGYLVVQPNAPGGLWNNVMHDPLVLGVIEDVIAAYRIDARRVHMTGFSQGGYMTWRFLCAHTELFASMAPAAAAGAAQISPEVGCTFTGTDVPSAEIDILYMHGHADALVNFANATTLRNAVVAHYSMDAGTEIDSGAKFARTRHVAPGGHVFEFLEHDYAATNLLIVGHCYPGSDDQVPTEPGQLMGFGCVPPNDFHWGETVVAFFEAHPKP